MTRAFERYKEIDGSFASAREGRFIGELIEAVDKADGNKFTAVVQEYDQMTKLDNWKTTLLLRIKNKLGEEPSLT